MKLEPMMMNIKIRQKYVQNFRCFCTIAASLTLLGSCSRPPPAPQEVRPVRTLVVAPAAVELQNTYAGEVRPRYESSLGFRVAGKIQQRLVNVGDTVKRGDMLARLDPQDLSLSEASSRANMAAMAAQLAVERADLERDRKLVADNVISQAAFDRQQSVFQASKAQFDAAQAQLHQSSNQVEYALLRADHDGAISAIEAEAGQVVAAGATVAKLAWSGEIEVAANVPEDQVGRIHVGMPVEITLWTDAAHAIDGKVRELSASADAATRTYSMRVSLPPMSPQTLPALRLGMTASVRIPFTDAPELIQLPLTALVEQQGQSGVWLFDPQAGAVRFRAVALAGVAGDKLLVAQGLNAGDRVVTAGAPLLHAGQKVTQLAQDSAAER